MASFAAFVLLGSVLAFAAARSVLAGGPEGTQTTRGGVAGEDLYVAGAAAEVSAPVAGDVLAAGANVVVGAEVGGNAVLAGGNVAAERAVGQDLFAAGGSVGVRGRIADDVRVAGGSVRVEAKIGGDLMAAGGQVVVGPGTAVTGLTRLAGGEVDIRGKLAHGLRARGDRVVLNAEVRGDVDLAGGTLVVGPEARVQGKLTWASPTDAQIDPAARIGGGVERRPYEEHEEDWAAAWGHPVLGAVLGGLAGLLALLVTATVLRWVFPQASLRAAATLAAHPWKSLFLGFALLVSIPVAAVLLLVLVVGVPLGLLLLLLYPVAIGLGLFVVAVWAAEGLTRGLFGRRPAPLGWQVLLLWGVVIVLALLCLVPVLGQLVGLAAVLFGLGTLGLHAAARYQRGAATP
jgi:hypothetical protein